MPSLLTFVSLATNESIHTYRGAIELLLGFLLVVGALLGLVYGFGELSDMAEVSRCECRCKLWIDCLQERRLCLHSRLVRELALFAKMFCVR